MLAWRIPRIARFVFFYARVTSWLPARVCGVRQEGVIPCRMVSSMWDEVHVQLHDVTGKVQHVRLCLPCKDARGVSSRAGGAHLNLKTINSEQRKNKPRFRVNMDSRGRGEIPPVSGAQDNN